MAKHEPNHKVSVIIPFYNRPDKTINSIKSVLAQTYKNIEIVLVNDASTGDIGAVTDFIKNHANIVLINAKANLGPAAARNTGIKAATGDYIAFLDSDDEFTKDKIKLQLAEMLKHNPDVSYTSYIKRSNGVDVVMSGHGVSGVVVPRMISSCPIATPTVMIRRKLLIDKNIFFNESIRIGEDTCFWLELAKEHEILLIEEPLTIVHTNELSSAYSYEKLPEGFCNILAYLTNDPYYSKFRYEISLLCNDFYTLNKSIQRENEENLKINGYFVPHFGQRVMSAVRGTLVYRISRKLYREGPRATYAAAIKKLT
jgi:glycosyltransferase involved in cell wall biosynthesis